MSFIDEGKNQAVRSLNEVEDVITKAIKKIGGRKENDICKYLPMTAGGYMHHFTMRKMKTRQPTELASLIDKFIIAPQKPSAVKPKQRAARGSRKKRDQITFTKGQLERLLNIARQAGDKEMITVLSPKKSLMSYKRDLIVAIRNGVIDHELWNGYVEAVQNQQAVLSFANEQHHNPFQN